MPTKVLVLVILGLGFIFGITEILGLEEQEAYQMHLVVVWQEFKL